MYHPIIFPNVVSPTPGGLFNFVMEALKWRFLIQEMCSYPACTRSIFDCEKCIANDCCKIHHDWGISS